ncbi:MAG: hypothetical protein HDT32_03130 [Clostridiales bacterium]|nr:hypothetical protein [Clostridiales bacterium]
MRNKKLIFAITFILTVSTFLCMFVGCNIGTKPAEILTSFYNSETKPKVQTVELTNLEGFDIQRIYGDVVTAKKRGESVYMLCNIAQNKMIIKTNNEFTEVIDGVFSTYKEVDGEKIYYFCDKLGVIKEDVKQEDYIKLGSQIVFSDGTVVMSTKLGVKTLEMTLENVMDMANYSNAVICENDDFIILNNSSDNFLIYDNDGNFKYSMKLSAVVNASIDDEVHMTNLGQGKVAIQVIRELTEVEAKSGFDFIVEGKYYDLFTYIYDLESRELKEVVFNNVINGQYTNAIMSKDDKHALLYVYDISTKHFSSDVNIIVTDIGLKEKVNLNDFVNGATSFSIIDESTFAISDSTMTYVFNQKGELINNYSNDVSVNNSGLINVGKNYYDLKGNKLITLEDEWTLIDATSDGLFYYISEDNSATFFRVWDTKGLQLTSYNLDAYKFGKIEVEGEMLCFTISGKDDAFIIYSSYDGKAISNKKYVSASAVRSGNSDYYIITAVDTAGNIVYYSNRVGIK